MALILAWRHTSSAGKAPGVPHRVRAESSLGWDSRKAAAAVQPSWRRHPASMRVECNFNAMHCVPGTAQLTGCHTREVEV